MIEMSKLVDKLRVALRGEQVRMGFGARSTPKPPGIGLIVDVGGNLDLAKDVASVADALVVKVAADKASSVAEAVDTAVWGVDLAGANAGDEFSEAGADFVVLDANSDASVLKAHDGATLLRITGTAPDGILRVIATLPVDAILPDQPASGRLKVADLLDFLRVGALAGKPTILPVGTDFDLDQLVSLRDAGVSAVLVTVKSSNDVEVVKAAREKIANFPMPPKRPLDRSGFSVSVPQPAVSHNHAPDPDDPDEDE